MSIKRTEKQLMTEALNIITDRYCERFTQKQLDFVKLLLEHVRKDSRNRRNGKPEVGTSGQPLGGSNCCHTKTSGSSTPDVLRPISCYKCKRFEKDCPYQGRFDPDWIDMCDKYVSDTLRKQNMVGDK